ncbi:class F sortase [Actinoplanes sp. NPDC049596]|uniref:class F sortase n=1 Tax=unclassified Actinoplanes TaxID=2626549 RepID=UPI0034171890
MVAAVLAGGGYLALGDRGTETAPGYAGLADAANSAGGSNSTGPSGSAPAPGDARPPGDPFGAATRSAAGEPTGLRVAAIGINTPLEALTLGADGALQPPRAFGRAGWYADGTAPGDTGPAVIAGHVDSKTGPAIFYRLRELVPGDGIDVVRGGRTVRFTVTALRWYPKSDFPTGEVYGPTPDRQLRLITCGGVFDRSLRSYRDNLVVYAVAG